MADSAPLLSIDHLSKAFGGSRALDEVSLDFAAGGIHALVGENGAGKSTLIRCCTGVLTPDGGGLEWGGAPFAPKGPAQALGGGRCAGSCRGLSCSCSARPRPEPSFLTGTLSDAMRGNSERMRPLRALPASLPRESDM